MKPIDFDKIKNELGDGPARFVPIGERSFKDQLEALTEEERECYDTLKKRWEELVRVKKDIKLFSDPMYLTFARCSPGTKKFNPGSAFKVMKNYDQRFLSEVNASTLESQLRSRTLFVVPGLKSKENHDVFYMRPSRYFPKQTSTQTIIDNLGYCMSTMVASKEKNATEGIAFMANMDNWGFSNFSISYCSKFMMMLQGRVPVRVRLFLIVNPPAWFDKIWRIMKPMLAPDFRRKVHMIPEYELDKFLMDGYQQFLPDDIKLGKVPTNEMIDDFIKYRQYVEKI